MLLFCTADGAGTMTGAAVGAGAACVDEMAGASGVGIVAGADGMAGVASDTAGAVASFCSGID